MARTLITESMVVRPEDIQKIPLSEETQILEGVEGEQVTAVGAYTFPISRPGEKNLNDRIYPESLWNNVIKKKFGEGAFGLCDHPTDGGSVKDAFCVWKNIRLGERKNKKVTLADSYLFGDWGRHAQEAIDAGGSIGLSSVGYGEFLEDEITIKDDYELVRPADWVLEPSYQVFGTKADTKASEGKNTPEAPKEEAINIKKERSMSKRTLEEKNFRLSMDSLFEKVDGVEDLFLKKEQIEEGISYFEDVDADFCSDLREKFDSALTKVNEDIKAAATAGVPEEITEKVTGLETSVADLTKANEELQRENIATKALLDSMREATSEVQKDLEEASNVAKVSFSAEEVLAIKKEHEEKVAEMTATLDVVTAETETLKTEVAELKKVNEDVKSARAEAVAALDVLEAEAEKDDKEKDDDDDDKEKKDKEKEETSGYQLPQDPAVQRYYETLRAKIPAVVKFKEVLLACKTLEEVQKKFLSLKDEIFGESYTESYIGDSKVKQEESVYRMSRQESVTPSKLPLRKGWV